MNLDLEERTESSGGLGRWLLPRLPSIVLYERKPVDPSCNGWHKWRLAVEKFVRPSSEWGFWSSLIHGSSKAGPNLTVGERDLAHQILKPNEECLQLLQEGAQCNQIQFPEFDSLQRIEEESATIHQLSEIARLPLIRAKLLAADGDFCSAAESLIGVLRIGEMICNGEGQMLHYLIGLWIRGAAVRAISRQAAMPETPRAALVRSHDAIEQSLARPDGLQKSLCIDFQSITLRQLDQTADSSGLDAAVESIVQIYYLSPRAEAEDNILPLEMPDADACSDAWSDELRRQLLFVLKDHPQPFDKRATALMMGNFLAQTVRGLDLASHAAQRGLLGLPQVWFHALRKRRQRNHLKRLLRQWPNALTPGPIVETDGEPSAACSHSDLRMTEADLIDARHRLRKLDNPLGLLLVDNFLSFDYSPFMAEHRSMMKSLRRLLAQRLQKF